MTKKESKKKTAVCKKCGKPGATHWVVTGEHSMDGPYHPACKPK